MRFKISWASLIAGSKCTVFALFYFVFEGNFQVQALGELIFEGVILRKVFCVTSLGGLYLEELIHEGAIFGILRYLRVLFPTLFPVFPNLYNLRYSYVCVLILLIMLSNCALVTELESSVITPIFIAALNIHRSCFIYTTQNDFAEQ